MISINVRPEAPPPDNSALLAGYLHLIAQGDARALKVLYQATSNTLFAILLNIVRDRSDGEDLLQETYVSVWNSAHKFDGFQGRPMAWLATIARNKAIDRRRCRSLVDADCGEQAALAYSDPAPCALTLLENKCREERLKALVGELSDRDAAALRMAFYDGDTYDTVALRLGIPKPTAHSIIRRSLINLRSKIDASAF